MASHLALILATLGAVARGVFHVLVPEPIRTMLTRADAVHAGALERYVFLHDLDKANCITVVYANESQTAVIWAGWQEMLVADINGRLALEGDGDALLRFCKSQEIVQISYFQKPDRQHGKLAAERLRGVPGVSEAMLRAIATHEVAYSFDKVNIPTYLEYFGELDEATRDLCLLASYADTMASLRPDGQPDLANFLFLAKSRLAAEAFVALETRLRSTPKLDAHKLQQMIDGVRKSPDAFESETTDQAYARIVAATKLHSFDETKLRQELGALVAAGTIDATLAAELTGPLLSTGAIPKELGKRLGKANTAVREALARATG